MSRTLTASDRRSLIRMASTMPVGSPERKAILAGLSKTPALKIGKKTAKLSDFEKKHIKAMKGQIKLVEDLVSRVTLNDASDAISDMEKVVYAAQQFQDDGYTTRDDLNFWNAIPEDIEDASEDLIQVVEAARDEIQYMIDAGMADDGYEDAVMEKMENEIMPQVEDAVEDFARVLKGFR